MATNDSKSFFDLPVTTQLVYLILTLLGFGFLLILNPITLFVLNIFKPAWANDFAHSDELYSERCQKFFTRQAKKWPWLWAKYWYTSKEIGCLTDDKQLDYYYNVSHSIETLNAMSIHNSAKVIGKDFEGFKEYIASVNTLNAMSTAISAKDAYINMSYNLFCAFIRASIEKDDMSALGDYLKRGTLPKDQVKISNDVINVIASLALADELGIDKAGKKGPKGKGITVEVVDEKIYIGVDLNVSYGTKIPDLCKSIQQKIRTSVENMTGMCVEEVNVNISSMNIEKTTKES